MSGKLHLVCMKTERFHAKIICNLNKTISTGLPAKSDSDFMFCLQSRQGFRID